MGRCMTPSSSNSGPVTSKPYDAYQSRKPGLRVEADLLVADHVEGRAHQSAREALTAGVLRHHDAADPRPAAVVEHSGVADETAAEAKQEMAGGGFAVAAVEVGVRRPLLHHEHLLPQPPHVVRRRGVEVGEGQHLDTHDKNLTVSRNAVRASGRKGSTGKAWIRSGCST